MWRWFFRLAYIYLLNTSVCAQADTEIYLFDIAVDEHNITLSNPKNVSNNKGYDNQPSFLNDDILLFSSTRSDQTDIVRFDIVKGSAKTWITDTPAGSEYSPLKIPNKKEISAIRLDLDGLQRLYRYDLETGQPEELLPDLKVGYHVWFNNDTIICTVLKEDRMDLVLADLKNGQNKTITQNVGRSLHKIPKTNTIGFVDKSHSTWTINALNVKNLSTKKLTDTFQNNEDIFWLNNNTLLSSDGKALITQKIGQANNWEQLMYFEQEEIHNISRIVINPSLTRLAFVSEVSPRHIAQEQLDAYNERNLEKFAAAFSEDVELYVFPEIPIGKGQDFLKERYGPFFDSTPDLHCELRNRIVQGNRVIDQEYITANGKHFGAIAIYEVDNGKIAKVTFIQ